MDYALDPNGDGDTSDAVDVINMSLGSTYGQIEDDLTLAPANAVQARAWWWSRRPATAANRPYIVGSPSTAPGVISVAQTQVPSAVAIPLAVNAPAAIAGVYANTETLDLRAGGRRRHRRRGASAAAARPATPAAHARPPAGKVALIDRGDCGVSLKVERAAKAGATGVLIGLVAPGDAFPSRSAAAITFVPRRW